MVIGKLGAGGVEEGCSPMVQEMASQEMVPEPQCSAGKMGLPSHT